MHTGTRIKACIQANFSTRVILSSKHQIKRTRHSFAEKLQQSPNRICSRFNLFNRKAAALIDSIASAAAFIDSIANATASFDEIAYATALSIQSQV